MGQKTLLQYPFANILSVARPEVPINVGDPFSTVSFEEAHVRDYPDAVPASVLERLAGGEIVLHDGFIWRRGRFDDKTGVQWYESRTDITASVQETLRNVPLLRYLESLQRTAGTIVRRADLVPNFDYDDKQFFRIPAGQERYIAFDEDLGGGKPRKTYLQLYEERVAMGPSRLPNEDLHWKASILTLAVIEYEGISRLKWGLRNVQAIMEHVT